MKKIWLIQQLKESMRFVKHEGEAGEREERGKMKGQRAKGRSGRSMRQRDWWRSRREKKNTRKKNEKEWLTAAEPGKEDVWVIEEREKNEDDWDDRRMKWRRKLRNGERTRILASKGMTNDRRGWMREVDGDWSKGAMTEQKGKGGEGSWGERTEKPNEFYKQKVVANNTIESTRTIKQLE